MIKPNQDPDNDDSGFDWLADVDDGTELSSEQVTGLTDHVRTQIALLSRRTKKELSPNERSLVRRAFRLGSDVAKGFLSNDAVKIPIPGSPLWEEWEWNINKLSTASVGLGEVLQNSSHETIRQKADPAMFPPLETLLRSKPDLAGHFGRMSLLGVLLMNTGDNIQTLRTPREEFGLETTALISVLARENGGLTISRQDGASLARIYETSKLVEQERSFGSAA